MNLPAEDFLIALTGQISVAIREEQLAKQISSHPDDPTPHLSVENWMKYKGDMETETRLEDIARFLVQEYGKEERK